MRKICPHIMGGYIGAIGSPPVVKLVDVSPPYVRQVRKIVGPDTLIIVRWTQKDDHQPLDDPRRHARRFVMSHVGEMVVMTGYGRDTNIAFSGYNEIPDSHAEPFRRFECQRLEEMHGFGLRSVVGDWSVGVPDFPTWTIYQPLLDAMGPEDILGLHEYWIDLADIANRYHIGRFSMVPALAGIPTVITEGGRDRVEDQGHAGWIGYCNSEEYLSEIRAADKVYCRYPQILGVTLFTIGQFDHKWDRFNLAAIWDRVVAEQEPWQAQQPIPVPEPEPVRVPMDGRVSQAFGEHPEWYPRYDGHPGVDLAAPKDTDWAAWHGSLVFCTIAGTAYTIEDTSGYGLYVYIMGDEADELLAHLSAFTIPNGAHVNIGDVVGRVGYTGDCKPTGGAGTHLHWGIRPRPLQLGNGYRGYVDPLHL